MAVSNLILTELATNLFKDTISANVAIVVKAGAGTFYVIHVDNLPVVASYVKLWDSVGAIIVGTTVPDWVIKVPASFKGNVLIATGGIVFATGLQVATVTAGGTGGIVSPTGNVTVSIAYT